MAGGKLIADTLSAKNFIETLYTYQSDDELKKLRDILKPVKVNTVKEMNS